MRNHCFDLSLIHILWNKKGLAVRITILPPFWATWWFRLMVIILILFFVWIIYKIRIRSLENQKVKLERIVRERTCQLEEANEELSVQADALKVLNSTKDKFFSIIGHDLKNPFFAINGLASLLKEHNNDMPLLQRNEIARMIEESSKNAASLLQNLLTWSRSQSNSARSNPELFDVSEIVTECFNLLQVNAEKKNIKLIKDISSPFRVYADKNMILTVIRNLINNALKFTNEGGQIIVSAKDEADICRISVEDTGVGMDDKTVTKLFRLDENVTTTGTSGETGTGLGLIICKEFIDKNNGHISVESEPGKGSRFNIDLPVKEGVVAKKEEPIIKDQAHTSLEETTKDEKLDKFEEDQINKFLKDVKKEDKIILVIDDNKEVRLNIEQYLSVYFTVKTAENGRIGIKNALEILPDIIISDVMMPESDGFEVCSTLKTDIRTSHIPIILLTARNSDISKVTGINMGADDYLTKPFSSRVLIARIKNLILQRQRLRERFSQEFILQPSNIVISGNEEKFLSNVIAIIEKNMENTDFSVADLSKDAAMSQRQFYRKLETLTGQPPVLFIRSIRLKRAAQFLIQSDLNINEISIAVGFSDTAYFTKIFREQFGITPKQYSLRKNKKK